MNLTLLFTRGQSLSSWDRIGMLSRETALYKKLQESGINITFITFGTKTDLSYTKNLPDITILCNKWGFSQKLYEFFIPLLFFRTLFNCDVIKTNQADGSDIALRAARLWRIPMIARCGYVWSKTMEKKWGVSSSQAERAREIELNAFSGADHIVVTTPLMKTHFENLIPNAATKTTIIPNYVATDQFKPINKEKAFDLIFIGRISEEKNISALLAAVQQLKIKILIIGNGELKQQLHTTYGTLNGRIQWEDRVPHEQLPEKINSAKAFILPSLYEGHPKTLIEAMACGLPVIGADSTGIKEIIKHNENGILCGTKPQEIQDAITILLNDTALQQKLGKNAHSFTRSNYSLDTIAQKELTILKKIGRDRNA